MNRRPLPEFQRIRLRMLLAVGVLLLSTQVQGQVKSLLPAGSKAEQGIDAAMSATADEIAFELKMLEAKEVAVDGFDSPHSSAGPRIALALRTALAARSIAINAAAEYHVAGTFEVHGRTDSGKAGLNMTIVPTLVRGEETIETFQKRTVADSEVIAAVSIAGWIPSKAARTGDVTPTGDPLWLHELFTPSGTAIAKSTAIVESSRIVRPAAGSPFGIEILREEQGRFVGCPVSEASAGGISKVGVALADNLAFAVHNNSGGPVGVEICIDGINILHFSKQWKDLGKWFLAAHGPGTPAAHFTGWHIEGNQVNSFQVARYANAIEALLGENDKEQTISVTFYKALESKEDNAPLTSIKILQGAAREMPIQQVAAQFGSNPLAIVNLRYEALETPAIQP